MRRPGSSQQWQAGTGSGSPTGAVAELRLPPHQHVHDNVCFDSPAVHILQHILLWEDLLR